MSKSAFGEISFINLPLQVGGSIFIYDLSGTPIFNEEFGPFSILLKATVGNAKTMQEKESLPEFIITFFVWERIPNVAKLLSLIRTCVIKGD